MRLPWGFTRQDLNHGALAAATRAAVTWTVGRIADHFQSDLEVESGELGLEPLQPGEHFRSGWPAGTVVQLIGGEGLVDQITTRRNGLYYPGVDIDPQRW